MFHITISGSSYTNDLTTRFESLSILEEFAIPTVQRYNYTCYLLLYFAKQCSYIVLPTTFGLMHVYYLAPTDNTVNPSKSLVLSIAMKFTRYRKGGISGE